MNVYQVILIFTVVPLYSSAEECFLTQEIIQLRWTIADFNSTNTEVAFKFISPDFLDEWNPTTYWKLYVYPNGITAAPNNVIIYFENNKDNEDIISYTYNLIPSNFSSEGKYLTIYNATERKYSEWYYTFTHLPKEVVSQYISRNGSLDIFTEIKRLKQTRNCPVTMAQTELSVPVSALHCSTEEHHWFEDRFTWNGTIANPEQEKFVIWSPIFQMSNDRTRKWKISIESIHSNTLKIFLRKTEGPSVNATYQFQFKSQVKNKSSYHVCSEVRNFHSPDSLYWGWNKIGLTTENFRKNYLTHDNFFEIELILSYVNRTESCYKTSQLFNTKSSNLLSNELEKIKQELSEANSEIEKQRRELILNNEVLRQKSSCDGKAVVDIPVNWRDSIPSSGDYLWLFWLNSTSLASNGTIRPIGDVLISQKNITSVLSSETGTPASSTSESMATDILQLATVHNLPSLKSSTESFLIESLSTDNAFKLLQLADKTGSQQLRLTALKFIAEEFYNITMTVQELDVIFRKTKTYFSKMQISGKEKSTVH